MTAPQFPELFPIAMGSEEETMLQAGTNPLWLEDPQEFVANFEEYIPGSIKYVGNNRIFLQNGGLMYDGGAMGTNDEEMVTPNVNLERATPECATPLELATCTEASERLLVSMLKTYVEHKAAEGEPVTARVQRRTIDAQGHGRASHDSIESRRPNWLKDFDTNSQALEVWLNFLETRSFITGAGYVSASGPKFAQKVQHIKAIDTYGYISSAYRNASEVETGPRIEVRCNDINISPWAIQMRVGGSALLFTMLQTPLVNALSNYIPRGQSDVLHLKNFRDYNAVAFDPEGTIQASTHNIRALDLQERIFELADEALGEYIELDDHYRRVITEIRYYCEDFRQVLIGKEPFSILADRSDMAAKFFRIFELNRKAESFGIERKLGDIATMATDFRYDNITVATSDSGKARVEYGHGYKLRSKGAFRMTTKPDEVERAVYYPPKTTRASIRGALIRRGELDDCSWGWVKHNGIESRMSLKDVMLQDDNLTDTSKA
jgi:hypothetical protein